MTDDRTVDRGVEMPPEVAERVRQVTARLVAERPASAGPVMARHVAAALDEDDRITYWSFKMRHLLDERLAKARAAKAEAVRNQRRPIPGLTCDSCRGCYGHEITPHVDQHTGLPLACLYSAPPAPEPRVWRVGDAEPGADVQAVLDPVGCVWQPFEHGQWEYQDDRRSWADMLRVAAPVVEVVLPAVVTE